MRDGQGRKGYWVSHAENLRRIAPQHFRPAAREEQISEHDAITRPNKVVDEPPTRDQLVYENLIGLSLCVRVCSIFHLHWLLTDVLRLEWGSILGTPPAAHGPTPQRPRSSLLQLTYEPRV